MFRWTEIQCSPVFVGNYTSSGHTVKVTSGHKVAKMDGFTFVVRRTLLESVYALLFHRHTLKKPLRPGPCHL